MGLFPYAFTSIVTSLLLASALLSALSAVGVDSPTLPVPAGDKISKEAFISHM